MFSHMARMALRAPVSSFDRELQRSQTDQLSAPGDFLVGLSVGQGLQPTGVAVVERLMREPSQTGRRYVCRFLRRWLPPATAYPILISNLKEMLSSTPLKERL